MYKKFLKNFSAIGVIQIANYVLPFLYVPVISRIIGPEKYGSVNFFAYIIGFVNLFIAFGFDISATREIAAKPNDVFFRNKIFNNVFNAQIITFIISIFLFAVAFTFVSKFNQEPQLAIYSYLTCVASLFSQNWIFQAMQDLQRVALLNFISKLLLTSLLLLLIKRMDQYPLIALFTSVVNIIISLISFYWAKNTYNLKFKLLSVLNSLSIINSAKLIFFSSLMITLYNNTNIIILGFTKSTLDVGYYTAGQKIISIIQMLIIYPLNLTLFPFISAQFSKGLDNGFSIVQRILPIVFFLLLFVGVANLVFSSFSIEIFFGEDYKEAVTVLRILSFIPLLSALNVLIGNHVMLNLKRDKLFFRITMIGGIVSTLSCLIFVKYWSYKGVAIAWNLAEMTTLILSLYYSRSNGFKIFKYSSLQYFFERAK